MKNLSTLTAKPRQAVLEAAECRGAREIPDRTLRVRMLEDALDCCGGPGIAVLLTGDGEGAGLRRTLERMRRRRRRIEILSWAHSASLRSWAEENGVFVDLDEFAITFLEPSRPGMALALPRYRLDPSRRPLSLSGAPG